MAEYPFTSALVTGASSGIGEALVHELARAGVPAVLVARRHDRLAALAEEHPGCDVLVADLTTSDGQALVADRLRSESEPIDLAVNNAGFGTSGLFHESDVDRVADEVELNVAALTRLSHAALSTMVPRRRGWLLNVSSVASFQPAPRLAVYAATKAYVTSLTESLHEEVRHDGVKVTALCPGLTRTEFQQVSSTEHYADDYPDFVWTTVEDVVRSALDAVVAGKAVAVPGLVYKGLAFASGVAPRGLARWVSGMVMRR
jgi:short-subunit dehydrogenase